MAKAKVSNEELKRKMKRTKNNIHWKLTVLLLWVMGRGASGTLGTTDSYQGMDHLQQSISDLRQDEMKYDQQIKMVSQNIRRLYEEEAFDKGSFENFCYVTHDDMRQQERFADQSVMAIKAPPGTTLEVPDPDEGMPNGKRRFQIFLKSTGLGTRLAYVYLVRLLNDEQDADGAEESTEEANAHAAPESPAPPLDQGYAARTSGRFLPIDGNFAMPGADAHLTGRCFLLSALVEGVNKSMSEMMVGSTDVNAEDISPNTCQPASQIHADRTFPRFKHHSKSKSKSKSKSRERSSSQPRSFKRPRIVDDDDEDSDEDVVLLDPAKAKAAVAASRAKNGAVVLTKKATPAHFWNRSDVPKSFVDHHREAWDHH
ncbi:hypothetical protein BBJ28_00005134 [Nothophytophthora sp. Chile5]|nr:hypothetical protein BBJ28_00005134 [Nothophytophthora sp. Chile5]